MCWGKDEKRKFRVYEWVEETLKHVADCKTDCMRGKDERGRSQENFTNILGEEGL